jgi:hypothetical protein
VSTLAPRARPWSPLAVLGLGAAAQVAAGLLVLRSSWGEGALGSALAAWRAWVPTWPGFAAAGAALALVSGGVAVLALVRVARAERTAAAVGGGDGPVLPHPGQRSGVVVGVANGAAVALVLAVLAVASAQGIPADELVRDPVAVVGGPIHAGSSRTSAPSCGRWARGRRSSRA